jgi:hypothetical protein
VSRDILLVGSIPLDTTEEVFRTFGGPLGHALKSMPDGEVGPRSHWISRVHYQVLSGHLEIETLRWPKPENGVERLNPRNAGDSWLFKVKPGVDRVRFGDPGWRLGYARDAINSYFVFKTMREKGVMEKHLRFQVSMPSVNSALPPRIFPDQADVAKIRPGYTDALAAEIGTIVRKIPNDDLAADPRSRDARLSFLLRHARRLAALRAAGPVRDRSPRQCGRRGVRAAGGLDPHSDPRRRA